MKKPVRLLYTVLFTALAAGACTGEDPRQTVATAVPLTVVAPDLPATSLPKGEANADVRFVEARQDADGSWTFSVTVAHPDQGWEDYADGWDVVLPNGTVVKPDAESPFTRMLLHPHVTEQPFTRRQRGIIISDGVSTVTVRAHDLVDGFGGAEVTVDLAAAVGPAFAVERP